MKYNIRPAHKKDMSQVLELIKELAVFEKEPDAVEVTLEDLENDGFGEKPAFKCFVAETENKVVGIALIYDRYSTWKGRIIHLEDLIVSQSMRGKGIGKALLNEVVRYADTLGMRRINWEVLDWNEPAIKFYEANGAKVLRDWDVVQLDQEGIKNYIAKL